ncbi:MAG: ATP-binding protein [Pirellulales bacterium]
MPSIDLPGAFYLGREHDLSAGVTSREAVQYPSKNLTTHAVCVGMTGSGKTGLCLSLLEEAALDGVPAIAIDPKGDLGNLLLAFPQLRPEDFRPWIDEGEAERKGLSVDDYAAKTAETWRKGLAEWDELPERIQKFVDSVERVIYTPGSSAGIPLSVIKSFAAPGDVVRNDADALRERIISAVSGLLALVGVDADPVQSREHIFLSNVLGMAWREGRDLDIAAMIGEIQQPKFDKVGVLDVEKFFPANDRAKLAMNLNNLLASPSFAAWMQGPPLDVQRLLYSPTGKPRISILSIAHLNDAERMFFVAILLNEVVAWVRAQPGTSSLRALLYMDEVFGYFPPTANPPSKTPMLTLLKQARAYGLGCVLATQNPVDLDYKGLSNAGTWFLGRLQTERDKARVIEGLEGASAQAGSTFSKRDMEAKLAALGNRVFLMNSVYDDAPTVFQTRWAMSYLRGPLTRTQIKQLMDPMRAQFEGGGAVAAVAPSAQRFVAVATTPTAGERLEYRPGHYAAAAMQIGKPTDREKSTLRFYILAEHSTDSTVNPWRSCRLATEAVPFETQPPAEAKTVSLPTEVPRISRMPELLKEHLVEPTTIESNAILREPLRAAAARARQDEEAKLRDKYAKRLREADERIVKKQRYYDQQQWQFRTQVADTLWRGMDLVVSLFTGGAKRRRTTSSVSSTRRTVTERQQAQQAKQELDEALQNKADFEAQLNAEREELLRRSDETLIPRLDDVQIELLESVWLPFQVKAQGGVIPAY